MFTPYPYRYRVVKIRCGQLHCDPLDDRQVEIQLD